MGVALECECVGVMSANTCDEMLSLLFYISEQFLQASSTPFPMRIASSKPDIST
jgi:hypothetical protein